MPRPRARHTVPMEIGIRPATPADAAGIARLLPQLGYQATAPEVLARLGHWSADPGSSVIVADLDGGVAGIAAVHAIPFLERNGSRGRLVALVVDRGRRRLGIARTLLAAAEDEARLLGCVEMEITSARDRAAAHAFYVAAGYADACGRAARYLKALAGPDGEVIPAQGGAGPGTR
jgi:GNAT superfamily N-acetyltransferase